MCVRCSIRYICLTNCVLPMRKWGHANFIASWELLRERERNMGIINLHFHFSQSRPETEKSHSNIDLKGKAIIQFAFFLDALSLSLPRLTKPNKFYSDTEVSDKTVSEMKYEIQVNIEPKVTFASINQFCLILPYREKHSNRCYTSSR